MKLSILYFVGLTILDLAHVEGAFRVKPLKTLNGAKPATKTVNSIVTKTSVKTSKTSSSSTITSDFCASTDTACWSCALALATVSYCSSSVIPDFDNADDPTAASCLCYNPVSDNSTSLVWVPNQFDYPFDFCTQYASTADPSDVSVFASYGGFCKSVGQVLGAKVTSSNLVSTTSLDLSQITGTAATAKASPTNGAASATATKSSGLGRACDPREKVRLAIIGSAVSWIVMSLVF